jgi:sulfur-oxidizing protein SoxZ
MTSTLNYPIRLRASFDGKCCLVKALLTHPMENGLSKSPDGQLIPARFITKIDLFLNGELVSSIQTGSGIAADPLFGWRIRYAKPGDKVRIQWTDNQTQTQIAETIVQ